ncbi:GAF domain-containing protein [Paractinoplanes atraurantiacus]|uniref:GAF domain-containing protein n=1 Tax=Paractinoplanes atraurantiacus TaxID=1036182 RepID=A0A285FVP5_9ACTN|nr:GAF domain-containing protein [Actinoplanes atraurantiacus]SNY15325.1 GAF domain-containing protein [Actinoplanes atraurantiacus]
MMLLEERPRVAFAPHDRLLDVARLGLDHEEPRPYLQDIVDQLAGRLGAPFALIDVLLDGAQVFLAGHGPLPPWIAEAGGTPIEWAFCRPFLTVRQPRIVRDLSEDPMWRDTRLVKVEGARAYIGVPLISHRGHVIGGLCAVDVVPRDFPAEAIAMMESLATEVIDRIESRVAAGG